MAANFTNLGFGILGNFTPYPLGQLALSTTEAGLVVIGKLASGDYD